MSALLKQDEEQNILTRLKLVRNRPSVSHLLFVDDSFIFREASIQSAVKIQKCMKGFLDSLLTMVDLQSSLAKMLKAKSGKRFVIY